MDASALYLKIQSQLDHQLPFVVYRKSGEKKINSFLQNDNHLYDVNAYDTSGFVFAPFDSEDKAILIPTDKSSYYSAVILSERKVQNQNQSSSIHNNHKAKKSHIKLVEDGIGAIANDSFKKVVLSRKEEMTFPSKDYLKVFQQLIDNYPNAFVYCWYHPAVGTWLGATPETLVTIKEDQFFTMALAGTQPYVDSLEVYWGAKEIEEQAMVTDFVLNELSSKVSSIEKSSTYTYQAGTLLHLRTDIKGFLKNKKSSVQDIIKVLHPTPAVCGLPKKPAKSFILKNELYDRKYYTGFLGELYINHKGKTESNLYVNLRCMEMSSGKAIIYVGGGITKDSISEKEWEETVRKTETMKKVLH
ncbi:chorismate-binding protein [uncultured Aquimarina sp.]|uniref:chorismate-binding protein n=1 Tax=uncultured Aquimarina sp. TaxID=575652 RepID=UPI00261B7AEB|nr:chorismate-binding protein [uncultured Aquimarina sp.]